MYGVAAGERRHVRRSPAPARRCGCSTSARAWRGRSPCTCGFIAPRMISHITSSIPSEPASRRYSRWVILAAASGSSTSMSRKRASHSVVDQPGALRLQLVRQSTGAEDHDALVARIRIDRPPDRLAEAVAAVAGGRRVLHDVDGERDHLARPRLGLSEGDRERHGQTVVDLHLVDEREVELVEDQRLGEMPRQLGVAHHFGHRPASEPFVGDPEALRHAEREGRDQLEREGVGVIVVDDDAHVGVDAGDPLAHRRQLGEVRRPVRVLGATLVDRHTDRRDVRGADATDQLSHDRSLRRRRRWTGCPRCRARRRPSSPRTPPR